MGQPAFLQLVSFFRLGLVAGVAQLVEHQLPKLRVAGSSPVARSGITKLGQGKDAESIRTSSVVSL